MGKGYLDFSPMDADGGLIELVHGPQGGYHVLIALRARWIDASRTLTGRIEGELDGEVRATAEPYLDFRCNPDGGLETWGTYLIWDATPEELDGRRVTIRAEVTDARGVTVAATAEATIHDPALHEEDE